MFRLPNGDKVEIFGPAASDPPDQFARNPVVAGLLVDDIDAAAEELRAAGIELVGARGDGGDGYCWQHFRAPDGKIFELVTVSGASLTPGTRPGPGSWAAKTLGWCGEARGRGIGRRHRHGQAIAARLATSGDHVIIIGRRAAVLEAAAEPHGQSSSPGRRGPAADEAETAEGAHEAGTRPHPAAAAR